MSFWKVVGRIVNPLPSIINANKVEGQSFGQKLLNVVSPAHSLIKANSGLTDLQLSDDYKALQGGGDLLTSDDLAAAEAAKAAYEAEVSRQQSEKMLVFAGVGLLAFLMLGRR